MEPKFINFFKYLEDKGEQKIPLNIKLLDPKQFELTPEDLNIKGDINLSFDSITSLPDGLKVGGTLILNNTKITSLPNDLKVGRDLSLHDTPLSSKTEAKIRQMAPNIKRNI